MRRSADRSDGRGPFFYGAYERLDRHESVFVPLLQDDSFLYQLTPSQQALGAGLSASGLVPAPLVGQLAAALTPGNLSPCRLLVRTEQRGVPVREERQQFLGRLDHTVRDGHTLFTRFNWTGQDNENDAVRIAGLLQPRPEFPHQRFRDGIGQYAADQPGVGQRNPPGSYLSRLRRVSDRPQRPVDSTSTGSACSDGT